MAARIKIEYEIPPMRAIYTASIRDDGHSDEDIIECLREEEPTWRVRKLLRYEEGE